MTLRSYIHQKQPKKTVIATEKDLLRSRPFAPAVQPKLDPPDLQTQLENAQRFGHRLGKYSIIPHQSTSLPIQPKLSIGAPGDKYEQEADRVAQQVVQQLNAPKLGNMQSEQSVQRETLPEGEDELQMKPIAQRSSNDAMPASEDLESAIAQARGRGQPLSNTIRQSMEQAFGADFSGVRVHTDGQSDLLNRSILSRAFTTGQDVFFRKGAYQPGSRGGKELIAHELTHVVQQKGNPAVAREIRCAFIVAGENHADMTDSKGSVGPGSKRYEEEEIVREAGKEYWKEDELNVMSQDNAKNQKRLEKYGSLQGDSAPLKVLEGESQYLEISKNFAIACEKVLKAMHESRTAAVWKGNAVNFATTYGSYARQHVGIVKGLRQWLEENSPEKWSKAIEAAQAFLDVVVGSNVDRAISTLDGSPLVSIDQWEKNDKVEDIVLNWEGYWDEMIPHPTAVRKCADAFKPVAEAVSQIMGWTGGTEEGRERVTKTRSDAMHEAALIAVEQGMNGVWKVGERHVQDILKMPEYYEDPPYWVVPENEWNEPEKREFVLSQP